MKALELDEAAAQPWRDPIVAEVRIVREQLFSAAGNDIHEFCRRLQEHQRASQRPVVSLGSARSTGSGEAA